MANIDKVGTGPDNAIRLVAVGDVLLGVRIQKIDGSVKEPNRKDPTSAFTFVSSILNEADIAFCNLEASLSDQGKPAIGRISAYRCSPNMVSGLTYAGFDLLSLANNHSMDYGSEALLDTIKILTENGIAYIGAGRDIFEARKPVILQRKGICIAFLGYSTSINQPQGFAAQSKRPGIAALRISPLYQPPHVNEEDLEMMIDDIKNTKSIADLTIVSCHWSVGYMGGSHTLTMHQPAVTHVAIDAGADLILGHGPHSLQGIEVYKGKVICYNLGNFVVDRDTPIKESVILNCRISNKQIDRVSFLPVLINEKGQPQPLPPGNENCAKIQQLMEKLSKKLGTTLSFEGAEGVVKL